MQLVDLDVSLLIFLRSSNLNTAIVSCPVERLVGTCPHTSMSQARLAKYKSPIFIRFALHRLRPLDFGPGGICVPADVDVSSTLRLLRQF